MRNWTHHRAQINGLDMHYVEEGDGPLVVLLHGFPHTWFSWRHQITALAAAGYRVVAPDLRGMGQTSVPPNVEDYRVDNVVADMCGLLDHLGEEQAVFSGLDFGLFVAYDIAVERPERVRGIIGLQNPFFAVYDRSPIDIERERGQEHFNHMSYYTDDPASAQADMEAHPREILTKIFHALSGAVDFTVVWKNPPGTSYRQALPEPPELPWPWLSEWELETYVCDYARSGFGGGIKWYLAGDLNWEHRRRRAESSTNAPFYFLCSEADVDLANWHGNDPIEHLKEHHKDVRVVKTVTGGGHMIAMENPTEVNAAFIEFLADLDRN
ncbi:alpha/beta fold hydrolase [Rhodococcus erythropolis]|uniref:alpha/beta fold hydrolase n=1 Tax=Rhodococcus erythropolis TaxID=1833 RepID=UPI001BE9106B|nr:alpha/beta hydrolase [Rhodococcus erythropolis]MBT2269874.1 alpha/beta hydrolase [Rhodococcus erythropolis]